MIETERLKEYARVMVERAVEVEKGDYVYLKCYSTEVLPLFEEVRRQVIKKGAFPHEHVIYDSQIGRSGLDYDWLKHASQEQLEEVSDAKRKELEEMDVFISIGGRRNERELNGVDPEKISKRKNATKELSDMIHEEKRWVLTRYPTDSNAQKAGMPTEEFEEFVVSSVVDVDWEELEEKNQRIKELFDEADEVRIVSEGTDLTLSIEGREGVTANGECNIPDGEVFYAPRVESAEGYIEFTYPGVKSGNEVRGIKLEFEDGKVVEASAETNEDFLMEQLDTDEGSRFIGELGIGTNRQIDRFVNNLAFDEKIGGTVHLALGMAYPECVPEGEEPNDSAIHWDIVKDLRKKEGDGGKIILDGEVVQEDGEWKIDLP